MSDMPIGIIVSIVLAFLGYLVTLMVFQVKLFANFKDLTARFDERTRVMSEDLGKLNQVVGTFADIKFRTETIERSVKDHESRLRKLEQESE